MIRMDVVEFEIVLEAARPVRPFLDLRTDSDRFKPSRLFRSGLITR
jgi:hypothetical protein